MLYKNKDGLLKYLETHPSIATYWKKSFDVSTLEPEELDDDIQEQEESESNSEE